jgi:hypothetical protein
MLGSMAKRPRDPNQLAKVIVEIAIGEEQDTVSDSKAASVQAACRTPRREDGSTVSLGTQILAPVLGAGLLAAVPEFRCHRVVELDKHDEPYAPIRIEEAQQRAESVQ